MTAPAVEQKNVNAGQDNQIAEGIEPVESAHFQVYSSASSEQTAQVIDKVEAFRNTYIKVFENSVQFGKKADKKLKLRLYKDQSEFKRNNKSSPWAEAFYLYPYSHAYFAAGEKNSYHWMVHEVTHQLNREVSGFPKTKWIDEGLATYFAASEFKDNEFNVGRISKDAYPIWWLSSLQLSGSVDQDIAEGKIIPLSSIITGHGGPDINSNVNLYYIQYWSLTHFLFHHEQGKYAIPYRELIKQGGSLESFEKIIGPVNEVEAQWYRYLRARVVEQQPLEVGVIVKNQSP
jgi:hypothetical protein